MLIEKNMKNGRTRPQRLVFEMAQDLVISFIVAIFIFCFFYFMAFSISKKYFFMRGLVLAEEHYRALDAWITGICIAAAAIAFLVLFLFMIGRRLSYLIYIINYIEKIDDATEGLYIEPEGNDELTKLAQCINYLSESQSNVIRKEKELKEKRELFIRSLSHDIRTPLTSMIAYSDFMAEKKDISAEEMNKYIELMQLKSEQIKELTDRLLEEKTVNGEYIGSMDLLARQIAEEWEEIIKKRFKCDVDVVCNEDFGGIVDVYDFRRIMDNLASNVEKYADTSEKVKMNLFIEKDNEKKIIRILQRNITSKIYTDSAKSYGIGINSIRKIAEFYDGSVEISNEENLFTVEIILLIKS